ncbi:hypothetical protein SERLA73DRAFT_184490 [Serpula lacrymans var. lacrymans S7.3]|uniref:AMP-dependent synthetase/ligase domain-containing protein n=2 Tax=Serpula lacrymans var. lacrymans TaxID=341189 RepID=F8Q3C5_SERL3|nr:amp-CoA ligase [Serpula lacrymans var. lacrymans S7.9]EGN97686.1 hypothetical protein SERLA73DRAFT_184490 [Serpula lacrymans var. lacrymans S7.3]EGO23280.1 amp-CoA ligase [Serpula lacrymans var. lacrymans S7.9]
MGLGESSKATRIYRTGDIGKLVSSPRGPMLEYVGRNDNQVKIRGQRLEPGEIEAVLCSRGHGIGQAAVVVTENDRMLAFVVKKDAEDEKVRDDAVKFTVNQNAWDAFQAQYDWESIDSTMTGRDFTGWVCPFLDISWSYAYISKGEYVRWRANISISHGRMAYRHSG